jgi:hypothetical protein
MDASEIIEFVTGLPGAVAVTASEATGAPEVAWGDTFFFHESQDDQKFPFATIVIDDYPGFDTASRLSRPGVFRLNIGVGRTIFEEVIGYPPAAHAEHHDGIDYSATDRLFPHPVYATQGWVSLACRRRTVPASGASQSNIVNPGEKTEAQARKLLTGACERAAHRRPSGRR